MVQLWNLINRRNVMKDPSKAMDACEDFFTIVVEARIVSSVMVLFGMNTTDDKPTASFIH